MTFRWLNKQGVHSSLGFFLQRVDRWGYEYAEGDRTIRVDVEPLNEADGSYCEEIYEDSLRKWLSLDDSIDELARVKSNISAALTFMQIKHRFRRS